MHVVQTSQISHPAQPGTVNAEDKRGAFGWPQDGGLIGHFAHSGREQWLPKDECQPFSGLTWKLILMQHSFSFAKGFWPSHSTDLTDINV